MVQTAGETDVEIFLLAKSSGRSSSTVACHCCHCYDCLFPCCLSAVRCWATACTPACMACLSAAANRAPKRAVNLSGCHLMNSLRSASLTSAGLLAPEQNKATGLRHVHVTTASQGGTAALMELYCRKYSSFGTSPHRKYPLDIVKPCFALGRAQDGCAFASPANTSVCKCCGSKCSTCCCCCMCAAACEPGVGQGHGTSWYLMGFPSGQASSCCQRSS